MNFAKQCPHEIKFGCSAWGIWCQKWNIRQRTSIMLGFARSIEVPFTGTRGASAVSKNGVSLASSMSCLQNVLGAGKYPVSPSMARRKLARAILTGFHRKSFRKIISVSSTSHPSKRSCGDFKMRKTLSCEKFCSICTAVCNEINKSFTFGASRRWRHCRLTAVSKF